MYFVSDGLRIAYRDEAPLGRDRGEAVLLIHGFASSADVNWVGTGWFDTLRRDGRRTIAFDHRGHGGSDKPHDPALYATGSMAQDALRAARSPRDRARRRPGLFHGGARRGLSGPGGAAADPFDRYRRPRQPPRRGRRIADRHRRRHGGAFPRDPDRSDAADVQTLCRSRRQRSRGSRGLHPGIAPEPHVRRGRPDRDAVLGRGRDQGRRSRGPEGGSPRCYPPARCSTFRAAITIRPSAIRSSNRAFSPSWPGGRDRSGPIKVGLHGLVALICERCSQVGLVPTLRRRICDAPVRERRGLGPCRQAAA